MNTQKLPLSSILIEDRQRQDYGDISNLASSLKRYGLIQPIVLRKSDNRLVAGGRRLAAATSLGWVDINFVYLEEMANDELIELEIEENVRRKEMTWQERCLAIKKIHTLKVQRNALDSKAWGHRETAEMLGISSSSNVHNALRVARRLEEDKEKKSLFWKVDTLCEALRLIIKEQEDEAMRLLAKSTLAQKSVDISSPDLSELFIDEEDLTIPEGETKSEAQLRYESNPHNTVPWLEYLEEKNRIAQMQENVVHLSASLHNKDCLSYMSERTEPFCDHIITDPPYGIDMDMLAQEHSGMSNISTVEDEHVVEENEKLLFDFLPLAFQSLRDKGFLVMFCDVMQWDFLYKRACDVGFKVQRWPIVWHKQSPCMNQMAQYNFTKNFEIAMVCRKGNATLVEHAGTSVFSSPHDDMRKDFGHPFVKPFSLWEFVTNKVSSPGQLIYEPFAGRGSGVISQLRLGRRVIANEKQENHYNHLLEHVKQHYIKSLGPQAIFK